MLPSLTENQDIGFDFVYDRESYLAVPQCNFQDERRAFNFNLEW